MFVYLVKLASAIVFGYLFGWALVLWIIFG
jgi:hypothetical protein